MAGASWEQLPNESNKAYGAFRLYLDQGFKRSHKMVAISLGIKNPAQISNWAGKFDWEGRIRDWEKEQVRLQLEAMKEEYQKKTREHLEQATGFRKILNIPLTVFLQKVKTNPDGKSEGMEEFKEMKAVDLFNLILTSSRSLDTLVKIERVSLGAPSEITSNINEIETLITPKYADKIAGEEEVTNAFSEFLIKLSDVKDSKPIDNGNVDGREL